jgi:hypothetical protein
MSFGPNAGVGRKECLMTNTRHPESLNQLVAFLEKNPMVVMDSTFANRRAVSKWWFLGKHTGALWFAPYPVTKKFFHTGLELCNTEFEIGFDFDERGFVYSRSHIRIRVEYAAEVSA